MAQKRIDAELVRRYFKEQGCEVVGEITTSKAPIQYKCKCGLVRTTCWNNYSRGYRCKACFENRFTESRKRRRMTERIRQELFTVMDVARIAKVRPGSLYYMINIGAIPAPALSVPGKPRKYYNLEDVKALQQLVV